MIIRYTYIILGLTTSLYFALVGCSSKSPDSSTYVPVIHIVFSQIDSSTNKERVYYTKSTNSGSSFSTPTIIDHSSGESHINPQILVNSQGNPYVIYSAGTWPNYHTYFTKSIDQGDNFSTPVKVNASSGVGLALTHFAIDSNENPHIVYLEKTVQNALFYAHSVDQGETFTNTPSALNLGSSNCYYLTIALDTNNNPHITYVENNSAYYVHSTDAGSNFSTAIEVDVASDGNASRVDLAVDKFGNPHIIFQQTASGIDRVRYRKSNDGGSNFTSAVDVNVPGSDPAYNARLELDSSGNPFVIFVQILSSTERTYYTHSEDLGSSFQTPVLVDYAEADSTEAPDIKIDAKGIAHFLFPEFGATNTFIYSSRESSDGSTIEGVQRVSISDSSTTLGFLELDRSGNPYTIMWEQGGAANFRIYFNGSSDAGQTFLTPLQVDTGEALNASYPDISIY